MYNEVTPYIKSLTFCLSFKLRKVIILNIVNIWEFHGESEHSSVVDCLCATVYNK